MDTETTDLTLPIQHFDIPTFTTVGPNVLRVQPFDGSPAFEVDVAARALALLEAMGSPQVVFADVVTYCVGWTISFCAVWDGHAPDLAYMAALDRYLAQHLADLVPYLLRLPASS